MNQELARKLGYDFKDNKLFTIALTHRSYHDKNNERMEFLGDSVVNCVIAEALYSKFPNAQEGDLSRLRASLINRESLGQLARQFDLGRYLILGPGELKSGGSERLSILSCGMEAIIGAIYLDAGFDVARELILQWYQSMLESISNVKMKDPKTTLQEYLQAKHMSLPVYSVQTIEGEAHQQSFTILCTVEGFNEKTIGTGTSRRKAEQHAAELMLGIIK